MSPSDFSDRLVPLCDGRPGLRGGLHVDVREPMTAYASPSPGGEGRGEGLGAGDSSPILDFISSDETLDRYDEIISAAGWKLSNYQRNPVFQNAHQYGDVIFTLGKALITEVRQVGSQRALFQRIQFATDVNPMARIAYGLYKAKFLNAVSVGFIPIRWDNGDTDRTADLQRNADLQRSADSDRIAALQRIADSDRTAALQRSADPERTAALQRNADLQSAVSQTCSLQTSESAVPRTIEVRSPHSYRRKYLEQELLEVSAVSIPANPNALALGLKSGAVEKSDLRDLADLLRATLDNPGSAEPVPLAHPMGEGLGVRVGGEGRGEGVRLLYMARQLHDILKHT